MLKNGKLLPKVDENKVKAPEPDDRSEFGRWEDIYGKKAKLEKYANTGKRSASKGEAMQFLPVAGMATGFGGIAKAIVGVLINIFSIGGRPISYIDIKLMNVMKLQIETKHVQVTSVMVSDETDGHVRKGIEGFAKDNGMELVLIEPGTGREEIKKQWTKVNLKEGHKKYLFVALVKQPSLRLIDKFCLLIGGKVMGGHGDFYKVVKSQLKDIMDICGIKYVFTSNIDNTCGVLSYEILGYFLEKVKQGYEAMAEFAQKEEGDKGGVKAIVDGVVCVMADPQVPDKGKLRDDYNGDSVFPFFNTNTIIFVREVFDREIELPVMDTSGKDDKFAKLESIYGHGLSFMKWIALEVDRGFRYNPAKYLWDVYICRSRYMEWHNDLRQLLPLMVNGKYLKKPKFRVSTSVWGSVKDINENIYEGGSHDHTEYVTNVVIGGKGANYKLPKYKGKAKREPRYGLETKCIVNWEGRVLVVYEHDPKKQPGKLIIEGNGRPQTMVTIKNSIIYVPAGKVVRIHNDEINNVKVINDSRFTRDDAVEFVKNAGNWTDKTRGEFVDFFFPQPKHSKKAV